MIKGFTLIELLVVVALIGILSAIGIGAYTGYTDSAKRKKAELSLNAIYLAEQEYKSNNGAYYYVSPCTGASATSIVNNLFDGVDNLTDQEYEFCVGGSDDSLSMRAKKGSCIYMLNEKSALTKSGC